MIEQHITYLQRTRDRDQHGFPVTYHLHVEKESVAAVPSFTDLRDRFGRCEGKVYRDVEDKSVHCGYVFARRERWYDQSIEWDSPKQFYTAETWITFNQVVITPIDLDA